MRKFLIFILLLLLFFSANAIFARQKGSDEAMEISTTGILAQKFKLKVIAENVANATTLKTSSGQPYRKKYVILRQSANGVKIAGVKESSSPFSRVYDPGNPLADKYGFIYLPNVNVSEEMVELSMTNLLYEANTTAFKSAKTMYQQSLELLK